MNEVKAMIFIPARESIPFTFTPNLGLFAIPAGNYRAVLKNITQDENDDGDPVIRFVYDIVAGENGPVKYAAAMEYAVDETGRAKLTKDLAAFLEEWEIDQMQGMPTELDLVDFLGDEVDMSVETFTSIGEAPYSTITGIHRAGTLITGEMMRAIHF